MEKYKKSIIINNEIDDMRNVEFLGIKDVATVYFYSRQLWLAKGASLIISQHLHKHARPIKRLYQLCLQAFHCWMHDKLLEVRKLTICSGSA